MTPANIGPALNLNDQPLGLPTEVGLELTMRQELNLPLRGRQRGVQKPPGQQEAAL